MSCNGGSELRQDPINYNQSSHIPCQRSPSCFHFSTLFTLLCKGLRVCIFAIFSVCVAYTIRSIYPTNSVHTDCTGSCSPHAQLVTVVFFIIDKDLANTNFTVPRKRLALQITTCDTTTLVQRISFLPTQTISYLIYLILAGNLTDINISIFISIIRFKFNSEGRLPSYADHICWQSYRHQHLFLC